MSSSCCHRSSRCIFILYGFCGYCNEEILMVGHAWSWILLQKRQKREIYVSFSIQERTSQRKKCLLLIILFRSENVEKKIKADVRSFSLDERTIKLTKTPIDALTGEFKQKHPMGPVVCGTGTNKKISRCILL